MQQNQCHKQGSRVTAIVLSVVDLEIGFHEVICTEAGHLSGPPQSPLIPSSHASIHRSEKKIDMLLVGHSELDHTPLPRTTALHVMASRMVADRQDHATLGVRPQIYPA